MTKNLLITLTLLLSFTGWSQDVYTGAYRSANNPYYWKNKLPKPGYWQQDVEYKIRASIDEKAEMIAAQEELMYWNNSPDTLREVYFHLYQNAFVKGAYMEELNKVNKIKPKFGKYEAAGLGTVVENLEADGEPLESQLDNTILKVRLNRPLYPGDSVRFTMDFQTYWDHGSTRRRMKCYPVDDWTHFNGVHWYPRISVYDKRKGWDVDQHLNKELYGDFGTFDVQLDFANNYVVDATGWLQNKDDIFTEELWEKLKVYHYKDKEWNEPASELIPFDSTQRNTWHFKAVNVHDFAFTADPSYRLSDTMYKGVLCRGLVQERHASQWQSTADFVRQIIEVYSDDFGDFAYPKIVAADAADGMEYPMMTLDGGGNPGYRGLLAHEIGHNWFYGMLGNNETYRAMLDEGFTQFLTSWAIGRIDGPQGYVAPLPKNFILRFIEKHRYHPPIKDARNFYRVQRGWIDGAMVDMNRHSNDYFSAIGHENGYGQVYYKPSTMLYNLQYVLGDSLFMSAMQNYVAKWKMAHPYVPDFRDAIHEKAKCDLDWFFDQWIESDKKQDYALRRVWKRNGEISVKLKRKQEMTAPIDLLVVDRSGDSSYFHIPNTPFQKKISPETITLPRWFGNDKMYQSYTFSYPGNQKPRKIIMDTSRNMMDENRLNNARYFKLFPKEKYNLRLDLNLNEIPMTDKYEVKWRPLLGSNYIDGLRPGLFLEGAYMKNINHFKLKTWYTNYLFSSYPNKDKEIDVFRDLWDYRFWYDTRFYKIPKFSVHFTSAHVDGLNDHALATKFTEPNNWSISILSRYMRRYDNRYLLIKDEWGTPDDSLALNMYLNFTYEKILKHFYGKSTMKLIYRNYGLLLESRTENHPYTFVSGEWIWRHDEKKIRFSNRLYGRFGSPTAHKESRLSLAGSNMEEMMNHRYYRSIGMFNQTEMSNTPAHFQMGGGLNLRAYNAYNLYIRSSNGVMNARYGNYGLGETMEIDFSGLVNFKPKFIEDLLHIDFYAFGDVGIIGQREAAQPNLFSGLIGDAGLGMNAIIKRFFRYDDVHPLSFRVDLPFFMSHPPAGEAILDFRYVFGISRTF